MSYRRLFDASALKRVIPAHSTSYMSEISLYHYLERITLSRMRKVIVYETCNGSS